MELKRITEDHLTIKVNGSDQTDENWFQEYPVDFSTLMHEWMDLVYDHNSGDWLHYDVDMTWKYQDEEGETHTLRYFHKAKEQ